MQVQFARPCEPRDGALALGVYEERRMPARTAEFDASVDGLLARAMGASRFAGKAHQMLTVFTPRGRVVLYGLGSGEDTDDLWWPEGRRHTGGGACRFRGGRADRCPRRARRSRSGRRRSCGSNRLRREAALLPVRQVPDHPEGRGPAEPAAGHARTRGCGCGAGTLRRTRGGGGRRVPGARPGLRAAERALPGKLRRAPAGPLELRGRGQRP